MAMPNFDCSEKGPGLVSTSHFVYDFSRKMFLIGSIDRLNFTVCCFAAHAISTDCIYFLRYWTMCAYCNCLLIRLWNHKIRNQPYLSYQAVLLFDRKSSKNLAKYLENKKGFLRWNKKHFFILLKEPQTISIDWFYLLCNHVATSTIWKLFVTYTFVSIHKLATIYFSQAVSFTTPHMASCVN